VVVGLEPDANLLSLVCHLARSFHSLAYLVLRISSLRHT
jgi:hypothetical protein